MASSNLVNKSLVLVAFCIIFVTFVCFFSSPPHGTAYFHGLEDPELVWDKLPSSSLKSFRWLPCYGYYYCARLNVPQDYAVAKGSQVSIALIKLPAEKIGSSDKNDDPVLLNPGGPGSSGVDFLLKRGGRIREILGGGYDLISFDPRGVGRSTPRIVVFPDNAEGATWNVKVQLAPLPNMTADAISRVYARSLIYNAMAATRLQEAAQYVGTAAVARDVLNIVKAHGREHLYYWGFSYGTIIGATFAAMFPQNVGRMVLDGVVDANDYYASLWSNNLRDFDAGLRLFFKACVQAGRRCALHEHTALEVEARLDRIFETLRKSPLAVLPADHAVDGHAAYGIVDYATARRLVFKFMFSPYLSVGNKPLTAAELASALAAAERGDGHPLWNLQQPSLQEFVCNCSEPNGLPLSALDDPIALAIACGEGEPVHDTVHDIKAHYKKMAESSSFADVWPNRRVRCNEWKIRAKERFGGPFVTNTSHPLLFVGNIADPATPIANAHIMSRGFNGSIVLTQASAGHGSLAATSSCTANVVMTYFRTGNLPEAGTVCSVESRMFD